VKKWLCKRENRKGKEVFSIFLFWYLDGQGKWEMTLPTSSLPPTSLKPNSP